MAQLIRLLGDRVHALGGASIEDIGGAPAHGSQRRFAPLERKVERAGQVRPVVVHRLAEVDRDSLVRGDGGPHLLGVPGLHAAHGSRSQMGLHHGDQRLLIDRAGQRIDHLTTGDQCQKGDGLNAEGLRQARILVDVDLHHLEPARELVRELVERRRHRLAGAAPLGPEVEQNREVALDDVGLELGLGQMGHGHGGAPQLALAPVPEEPEQEEENLDDIHIHVQRAEHGKAGRIVALHARLLDALDALCIVGR